MDTPSTSDWMSARDPPSKKAKQLAGNKRAAPKDAPADRAPKKSAKLVTGLPKPNPNLQLAKALLTQCSVSSRRHSLRLTQGAIDKLYLRIIPRLQGLRKKIQHVLIAGASSARDAFPVRTASRQPEILSPTMTLCPHQLTGLNWQLAIWATGASGILADDMGLGGRLFKLF
jgi:hypothetical protein